MKKISGILMLLFLMGINSANAETAEREVKVKAAPASVTTQPQAREVQVRPVTMRPAVVPVTTQPKPVVIEKIKPPVVAAVKPVVQAVPQKKTAPAPSAAPKTKTEGQKGFFQSLIDRWFPQNNSQAQ